MSEHSLKNSSASGFYRVVDVNAVFLVARNEFDMLMDQPLTFIVAMVILAITVIQAAASPRMQLSVMAGIQNSFWYTTVLCSFLALCVGVISISGERSDGSIRVLLTKPLYRRDVVAGKFLGGSLFMLITVIAAMLVVVTAMLITHREPVSYTDLTIRIITYSLLLSIYCILTLVIAMLIGTVFKDLSLSLTASFSYIFFTLIEHTYFNDLGSLFNIGIFNLSIINPYNLYWNAFCPPKGDTVFMSTSFTVWLDSAAPYILLLLLYVAFLFLLCCLVFNREEA